MKLSIIIVNWNNRNLLQKCLESLIDSLSLVAGAKKKTVSSSFSSQPAGTEIIVVDNGSTDGSTELVKSSQLKVQSDSLKLKVIENKENLGFSKGNNIGIRKARGEYIMLLNSDTIVKEGAIATLVNYLDLHPEVDIVGPMLLNTDGSPQPNCGRFPTLPVVAMMLFKEHFGGSDYVRQSPEESGFVDWLMGAAFMARKEVFEKIGGLDEKIFMYMEEIEWFYRAAKAGFKAYFLKEAEIVHLGRGSSKSGRSGPILNIYRGIIYFYRKHKSYWELIVLLAMLKLKAIMSLMLGYLKNDDYLKQTYGQALKIN